MNMVTLSDNLRHLASLKAEKRRLAELTKENNTQIEQQEQVITVAMLDMADAAGLSSVDDFSVSVDGRRYSITTKPYYSIPDERRDEAFKALHAVGLGDLIVPRVDDRSLTKALMELAEDAGGELPEQYQAIPLTHFDKMTISDRKVG